MCSTRLRSFAPQVRGRCMGGWDELLRLFVIRMYSMYTDSKIQNAVLCCIGNVVIDECMVRPNSLTLLTLTLTLALP